MKPLCAYHAPQMNDAFLARDMVQQTWSDFSISARTSYEFYRKMCKTLGIKISKDLIKGSHSFRRSRETEVINKSGGNIILAAGLFGHSTQVAKKHYYTGLDMGEARKILVFPKSKNPKTLYLHGFSDFNS